MSTIIDQIKELAAEGFGTFVPAYFALRYRHPAIQTARPYDCSAEAVRRGLPSVNIYLAGPESVVCWPYISPEVD